MLHTLLLLFIITPASAVAIDKILNVSSRTSSLASCIAGRTWQECSKSTWFISDPRYVSEVFSFSSNDRQFGCKTFDKENLQWCRLQNVCLSGRDGTLFPNITQERLLKTKVSRTALPFRGHETSDVIHQPITRLTGITWISGCFRQRVKNTHPNHFMMGIGRVISHLIGTDNRPDNIVLHQCPNPFQSDFQINMMLIFWVLMRNNSVNLIMVPYDVNDERFICIENGLWQPNWSDARPLGNHTSYVKHGFIDAMTQVVGPSFPTWDLDKACRNFSLRIGVFIRSEENPPIQLRKFVNLEDVVTIAKKFSSNVFLMTTDNSMSLKRQVEVFNSFDVLITPH